MMIAALDGDKLAYRRLLGELQAWLARYYRRRLPADLVDDAVQEALVAVHTKRASWDPARPLGPWLAAIARYKWIDRLRAMAAAPTEPLPDEAFAGATPGLVTADSGSAVLSAQVLGALLATLKPAQAQVIRLVKLDGFSIEEAAAATGQSASLVKVNIHRGLAKLMRHAEAQSDDA